ncbi:hypothetical protein DFH94DRAFT_698604 [Russula ochroleuca]|uniref:Uncharacterized protein n=1 Tax=Russula ochroleuca TaxID=152965 RepID=A0A9P5JV77_9AGAM|nr:hypothetical protein DFH94DRAFT_698604 [Russula ochroleuca]
MTSLRQYLEGKIDFEGQKLVERITHFATIELAVFSFFLGFLFQSIQVTFVTFGLGAAAILVGMLNEKFALLHVKVGYPALADVQQTPRDLASAEGEEREAAMTVDGGHASMRHDDVFTD